MAGLLRLGESQRVVMALLKGEMQLLPYLLNLMDHDFRDQYQHNRFQ
jgi:hypothetical protein